MFHVHGAVHEQRSPRVPLLPVGGDEQRIRQLADSVLVA
jgi:hypothetical protein